MTRTDLYDGNSMHVRGGATLLVEFWPLVAGPQRLAPAVDAVAPITPAQG